MLTAKHRTDLRLAGRATLDLGAVLLLVGGTIVTEVHILAARTAVGLDTGILGLVHLLHLGAFAVLGVILHAIISSVIFWDGDSNREHFIALSLEVGVGKSGIVEDSPASNWVEAWVYVDDSINSVDATSRDSLSKEGGILGDLVIFFGSSIEHVGAHDGDR